MTDAAASRLAWQQGAALVDAAKRGDNARVQQLLAAGVPVDVRDRWGYTALVEAAQQGHIEVLHTLLNAGADTEAIAPPPATSPNPIFGTALAHAVLNDRPASVQTLLAAGADPNAPGSCWPPAMWAAGRDKAECLQLLLDADPQIGASSDPNSYTGSCLHAAAAGGNPACISLLLGTGASVAARDSHQHTPLHSAAEAAAVVAAAGAARAHQLVDSLECIRLLHQAGADLNARDAAGNTARDQALDANAEAAAYLLAALAARDAGGHCMLHLLLRLCCAMPLQAKQTSPQCRNCHLPQSCTPAGRVLQSRASWAQHRGTTPLGR